MVHRGKLCAAEFLQLATSGALGLSFVVMFLETKTQMLIRQEILLSMPTAQLVRKKRFICLVQKN